MINIHGHLRSPIYDTFYNLFHVVNGRAGRFCSKTSSADKTER